MRAELPSLEHGKTKRTLAWSICCTASEASHLIRLDFIVSLSRKLQTLKESAFRHYTQSENMYVWSLTLQAKKLVGFILVNLT